MSIIYLTLLILSVALWLSRRRRTPPYPPGPPGDPLIGHVRVIPPNKTSETFQEWTKVYGDVIYLRAFGRQIIVLGSEEVAQELLDVKGNNYKCRPDFPVYKLFGWTWQLAFIPYGKDFLKHRRVFQQFFGPQEISKFSPDIASEARILVKNLHDTSGKRFMKDIHRYILSIIMRISFSHQMKSDDDVFYKGAEEVVEAISRCGPVGNTPVDFFPWLRHFPQWFPGAYYAGVARAYANTTKKLEDSIIDYVRAEMTAGKYNSSFISQKLEDLDSSGLDPTSESFAEEMEHIKGDLGAIFFAGSDTTKAVLDTFFLLMLAHPEIQDRAYEEIMSVVGTDSLPNLSVRESLPYVNAIVQEIHRWNPVAPLGIPHRALEDDIFRGMYIPKGAMVVANERGMGRDERIYSNPNAFDPTHFLPKPSGKTEPKFTPVFGHGRRICPGKYLADTAIWLAISSILATLKIVPPDDGTPMPDINEGLEFGGPIADTKPFTCKILVRSESARQLISQIE